MNILELTKATAQKVNLNRLTYPNIRDWLAVIDPLLKAAGQPTIGDDVVEDIHMTVDELQISTSYTVRGCDCENQTGMPLSILEAENPLKAANQYRLGKELSAAKFRLAEAQRAVEENEDKIAQVEADLLSLA